MFGFGFKSKVKTIVEEDLESFVTPMFAGRFSRGPYAKTATI